MSGYYVVNLRDYVKEIGENELDTILSIFSCPLNKDVEYFLKAKAKEFSKRMIASTYFVFTSYKKGIVLVGYFALANKYLIMSQSHLSRNLRDRIKKFGTYDNSLRGYIIPALLIAQLGKNYANGYNELISGDELLKIAVDKVVDLQEDSSGKIVYIECEDNEKLIRFYSENGFVSFGKRLLDKDESNRIAGKYLMQMLKYIDG